MSILISWKPVADAPFIEVYRAANKTDTPVLLDTLAGTETSYTDTEVERNHVYWYTIVSVNGAESTKTKPIPLGYFPTTGPGPSSIVRGDWSFGLFGTVLPADVLTFDEIKTLSGIAINQGTNTLSTYYKWVVNGKIIFIPDSWYNGSLNKSTAKVLWYDQVAGDVLTRGEKGDYSFGIRAPYATTKAADVYYPDWPSAGGDETLKGSELAALACMLMNYDTNKMMGDFKYADVTSTTTGSGVMTSTFVSAATGVVSAVVTTTASIGPSAVTANRPYWPVLELLFE